MGWNALTPKGIFLSSRLSYLLAIVILLVGAYLRFREIVTLPAGLHDGEIIDIRIAETARSGNVELFYDLGGEGREGLYHASLVFVTALVGNGPLGYRMLSLWSGILTLALVYALGRRLFSPLAGLASMGIIAVSFWPVLLSRQITRETLLPLLISYILFALATALPVYRFRRKRGDNTTAATALGIVLGLILYIHPIGLLAIVFSMLFIAFMLRRRQKMSRRRLSYIGYALLLMIIIGMPYLISTIRRPNLSGVDRILGSDPTISLNRVADAISGIILIGDSNPVHNLPERALFDPITGIIMLVGIGAAIRRRNDPKSALLLISSLVLAPVFLLAANAPNFLHYAAVLPLLALFFGRGIHTIASNLPRYGVPTMAVVVAGILAWNYAQTSDVLFSKWPDLPEVQTVYHADLGTISHYLDREATSTSVVVCGWAYEQSPSAPVLNHYQMIDLMMNRREAPIHRADCSNALVMTNGGADQQLIVPDPAVFDTSHPEVQSWLSLATPVQIDGVPANTIFSLDVESELADRIGLLTIEAPVQYSPEAGGTAETPINTPVTFGGNITFLGYVLDEPLVYNPGSSVTAVTYWRVDGLVPPDLRLFTHILADPGASPPANRDVIHVDPHVLENRDVLVHVTQVQLPESLPTGEYTISVGAYQDSSDDRLPVLVEGEPHGDRLFLYSITVE